MKIELVIYPDPRLLTRCTADPKVFLRHIDEIKSLMMANGGAGIAAPQVGILERAFIMGDEVFCEPVIQAHSKDITVLREQCLSIPSQWNAGSPHAIDIARYAEVQIAWKNEYGEHFSRIFRGYASHVVQHELDHLDGVTIIERNKQQEDIFFDPKFGE